MIFQSLTFARSRGNLEVLKTEGEARGFQPSRETLRMLMNGNIILDCYCYINSAKNCEKEENIAALNL